uniref:Uncharacterized protein n=1 Tax=Echeneis naucrates TaxID=173247 RepID=A0A665UVE0_ECHNA
MGTQGTGRKRSTKKDRSTAEDDALNLIAREAEARLAAKRAARAEAREIRMKELERQQKELSDDDERMSVGSRGSVRVEDRDYLEKGSRAASSLTAATLTSLGGTSSRRGSGDTSVTADTETSVREIKEIHELKDQIQDVETKYSQNLKEVKETLAEVEEKYRKAMVSNAQLDNEKNNLMYQVDTLKDSLMELEELLSESRREYEEKVKEYEREKHAHAVLQFQFNEMKEMLKQSEELLNEIRQLRMKQDGFVREISDLQETVEWKDKKIGALERQKEYTDAIRTERDELREEVVKLKDILKKHGIVLGPDLNINGDSGEAEVDGSPSQQAQDSQMPPTEGNNVLGNTEEAQLRSSGEEEVDPEQQQEMLKEEAKENKLSSDTIFNVADVSTLETSHEEQQQTHSPTEECSIRERDFSKVDSNGHPIPEAKDIIVCCPEAQKVETSAEFQETGNPEGGDSGETRNPEDTETKGNVDFTETCNNICEKQEQERKVSNTESYPQQDVIEDNLPHETTPVSNTDLQHEPENAEEAGNVEEEELSSKSQSSTASGKKKKKKKRGKKKGGNQLKADTEKENSKIEEELELATNNNAQTKEPETLNESKIKKEQERQKMVVTASEPTETALHKDNFEDLRMDHVTNEQRVETETEGKTETVTPTDTICHTETAEEIRVVHITNEQNEQESLESEIETGEAVASIETLKDLRTQSTKDEQKQGQTSETENVDSAEFTTCSPEAAFSTHGPMDTCSSMESSDGLGKECPHTVEMCPLTALPTNGEGGFRESEVADEVEDEVGSVVEMEPECLTYTGTNSKEIPETESHGPHNGGSAADESESTNSSEREDLISMLPPCTGDLISNWSDSKLLSELPVARTSLSDEASDKGPEKDIETVKYDEESKIETEEDCVIPFVVSPDEQGGDSELKQDAPYKEELNEHLEKSVEPDKSSHEEKSEIGDIAVSEESLLETEHQVEPLEDVESQKCKCVETIDDSNTKLYLGSDEIDTTDVFDTPESLCEATEAGSSVEQDHKPNTDGAVEGPQQQLSQSYQETGQ